MDKKERHASGSKQVDQHDASKEGKGKKNVIVSH
jgi:hypothetical protein